mmetsp:Transcript_10101/g.29024  ORF Transcript_10101/g.29024 Transcript_10101/m.29024 type:complete len:521 (-) Transcript_10101:355-1917(-)
MRLKRPHSSDARVRGGALFVHGLPTVERVPLEFPAGRNGEWRLRPGSCRLSHSNVADAHPTMTDRRFLSGPPSAIPTFATSKSSSGGETCCAHIPGQSPHPIPRPIARPGLVSLNEARPTRPPNCLTTPGLPGGLGALGSRRAAVTTQAGAGHIVPMCDGDCGSLHGIRPGHCSSVLRLLVAQERRSGTQKMDILSALPKEVSLKILSMLSPRDIAHVGLACHRLHQLESLLAASNELVFLTPSPVSAGTSQHPNPGTTPLLDTASWPRLVKTSRPGLGTFMGAEPVNSYSTLFEATIERMEGAGLDIGVAPTSALEGGNIRKSKAWLYDCWGRASHSGHSAAYGAKVRPGDRVGVLYNAATDTLSFLLNGVSMGVAFSGLRAHLMPAQMLYPIISMPFIPGEAVLLSHLRPAGAQDMVALERSSEQWVCPSHPDDSNLLVETLWAGRPYRLPMLEEDMLALTIGAIKKRVASLMQVEVANLSVLVGGQWPQDSATLQSCRAKCNAPIQRIIVHTYSAGR